MNSTQQNYGSENYYTINKKHCNQDMFYFKLGPQHLPGKTEGAQKHKPNDKQRNTAFVIDHIV
jgi:hypothetical protein